MSCALSILPLLKLVPLGHDVIKMPKDDALDGSLVAGTHVVGVGLDCLESLNIEPVLRLSISLAAVNVNRLAPFISIEKEPLAKYHQYCRHLIPVFSVRFPLILPPAWSPVTRGRAVLFSSWSNVRAQPRAHSTVDQAASIPARRFGARA